MNFIFICLLISLVDGTCGLQISMVASRSPFGRQRSNLSVGATIDNNSRVKSLDRSKVVPSVTSTLISQLACMALKRRLHDHSHVSCDLTTESNNLLFGRVGPVTVKGRGWRSPLGLTCRAIEATVNECRLDMGRIISNQKLVLTTQAEGRAMVALSATDFGNFITHPLMKPPSPPKTNNNESIDSRLIFLRENVSVNPSLGVVIFYGTYAGSKWKFTLQRAINSSNGGNASIQASLEEESRAGNGNGVDYIAIEQALATTTSIFFNEMLFELDGTFLSFEDMMLTEKGREPSVMISLRIKVKKFPSPGLEF